MKKNKKEERKSRTVYVGTRVSPEYLKKMHDFIFDYGLNSISELVKRSIETYIKHQEDENYMSQIIELIKTISDVVQRHDSAINDLRETLLSVADKTLRINEISVDRIKRLEEKVKEINLKSDKSKKQDSKELTDFGRLYT